MGEYWRMRRRARREKEKMPRLVSWRERRMIVRGEDREEEERKRRRSVNGIRSFRQEERILRESGPRLASFRYAKKLYQLEWVRKRIRKTTVTHGKVKRCNNTTIEVYDRKSTRDIKYKGKQNTQGKNIILRAFERS